MRQPADNDDPLKVAHCRYALNYKQPVTFTRFINTIKPMFSRQAGWNILCSHIFRYIHIDPKDSGIGEPRDHCVFR